MCAFCLPVHSLMEPRPVSAGCVSMHYRIRTHYPQRKCLAKSRTSGHFPDPSRQAFPLETEGGGRWRGKLQQPRGGGEPAARLKGSISVGAGGPGAPVIGELRRNSGRGGGGPRNVRYLSFVLLSSETAQYDN